VSPTRCLRRTGNYPGRAGYAHGEAARRDEVFGTLNVLAHSRFQIPASTFLAPHGYSVLELMFAVGLVVTISAMTAPNLLAGVDEYRTRGAARYVSARLQSARMEAVMRSRAVAVRFEPVNGRYAFAVFVDGNHNGVLTADIARGIDEKSGTAECLADAFPGVDFGTLPGLPPVDAGGVPPGNDPIRLGAGGLASFTAIGTATTGSLYVRGRQAQYVVRIFGASGKTRVQKFNTRTRQWKPL
jgi:type II secretory pathway pseudopilin PulG